jgi:hypothetical protein
MSLLDKVKKEKIINLDKVEKVVKKDNKEIDFNEFDEIEVYSYVDGQLFLKSDDPRVIDNYTFNSFLEKQYITYGFLKSLRNKSRKAIERPAIYIANKNVIKSLRLERIYKDLFKPEDFDLFFDKSKGEMIEIIDGADINLKKLLRGASLASIKKGTLNDINKIKILSEKLDFMLEQDTKI